MSLSLLMASCNYDIKHNTPEVLDTVRKHARIYKAIEIANPKCGDPKFEFVYSGENIDIDKMNGHICFPTEQAEEMRRYYVEYLRRQDNCN